MLKSRYEHEVERINVYQDRFLVANTAETLMLGDMDTCCLSEVSWETTGTEKYHFDNPQVLTARTARQRLLGPAPQTSCMSSSLTLHARLHCGLMHGHVSLLPISGTLVVRSV